MKPSNTLIANATVCSGGFNSIVIWSWDIVRCSYQVAITGGTCNGTFTLQGSNDYSNGLTLLHYTPTNWSNIGSSSMIVCSTSAAAFAIPAQEVCHQYLRVNFTPGNDGPTGSATIRFNAFAL